LRCALRAAMLAGSIAMLVAFSTFAAERSDSELIDFDIPQQRADLSLTLFAEQADITLLFPYDTVKRKTSNRLHGRYSPDAAVTSLLKGTGLEPVFNEQGELTAIAEGKAETGEQGMSTTATDDKGKRGLAAVLAAMFLGNSAAAQTGAGA